MNAQPFTLRVFCFGPTPAMGWTEMKQTPMIRTELRRDEYCSKLPARKLQSRECWTDTVFENRWNKRTPLVVVFFSCNGTVAKQADGNMYRKIDAKGDRRPEDSDRTAEREVVDWRIGATRRNSEPRRLGVGALWTWWCCWLLLRWVLLIWLLLQSLQIVDLARIAEFPATKATFATRCFQNWTWPKASYSSTSSNALARMSIGYVAQCFAIGSI